METNDNSWFETQHNSGVLTEADINSYFRLLSPDGRTDILIQQPKTMGEQQMIDEQYQHQKYLRDEELELIMSNIPLSPKQVLIDDQSTVQNLASANNRNDFGKRNGPKRNKGEKKATRKQEAQINVCEDDDNSLVKALPTTPNQKSKKRIREEENERDDYEESDSESPKTKCKHNAVERKRRDKISLKIDELSQLIPRSFCAFQRVSKGQILTNVVNYIKEAQSRLKNLGAVDLIPERILDAELLHSSSLDMHLIQNQEETDNCHLINENSTVSTQVLRELLETIATGTKPILTSTKTTRN